jgi:hypothetical protein
MCLYNLLRSHYFQIYVPLQEITLQEIPLQEVPLRGIYFYENFVQKVWMDQFLLPVLWVKPIQERLFHFLVLFSSGESYPLHQ